MLPRDPRLRPDLEVARPGDIRPRSTRVSVAPEPWSIRFGGSTREWRNVSVRAWATDTRGRDVIDVEWHVNGDTREESFVAERAKMRRRW